MTKGELLNQIKDYPDDATIVIVERGGRCNDLDEIYRPILCDNEIQLLPTAGRLP